jgi:hypothetical protein
MNTYTAIVQGLYRMREINYNQSNAFLIKEIKFTGSDHNSKLDELIKYIKSNDVKYLAGSKSKYYEQKILTALRSIEPNRDSYKYLAFNPSLKMGDEITREQTFNHDYQKNQFITYINCNLEGKDDIRYNIIRSDLELYKQIIPSDKPNITIQKQSQIQKQKEASHQISFVNNENKKSFRDISFITRTNLTYLDLFTLNDSNNNMYIKHTITDTSTKSTKKEVNYVSFLFNEIEDSNVPIMLRKLLELGIKFTPSAADAIVSIYINNIPNDLFYLYRKISSKIYLLLTSEDIVQFKIFNKYQGILFDIESNPTSEPIEPIEPTPDESIILLNKFDTSDEIIILLMLFIMNIPSNSIMEDTKFLEIFSNYKNIISEHWKTTYKYDITNINKRFAKMMIC